MTYSLSLFIFTTFKKERKTTNLKVENYLLWLQRVSGELGVGFFQGFEKCPKCIPSIKNR
jgi:hypothetical protein